MQNPMFILLWLCSAAAIVLAYFKATHGQWPPAVLLFIIGASVLLMNVWLLRFLNQQEIPIDAAQSAAAVAGQSGSIIMQVSRRSIGETLQWAVGLLYGSVMLVQYPDILWRWWLSYPAAALLLMIVPFVLLAVTGEKLERVVADAGGIEVRSESRSITTVGQKVVWRDVAAVKMIEYWAKEPNKVVNSQLHGKFIKRDLVLLGRDGKELLQLADPLDPPQAYQRFLDAIPLWTKLAIQKVTVEQ